MSKIEEYPMHWRCRVCGTESDFSEKKCPGCDSDLLTYGEQIFDGQKPPKIDGPEIIIEGIDDEKKSRKAKKREQREQQKQMEREVKQQQQIEREQRKAQKRMHKQEKREKRRGGWTIFLVILLIIIVLLLAALVLLLLNRDSAPVYPTQPPTPVQTQPVDTAPVDTAPPATDPPVTEPPATKPPVTEPPVTEPPVTEPPVTEPPVTEPPVTEPPATDPPVTDPPVTEPSIEEGPWLDNVLKADFNISDYKFCEYAGRTHSRYGYPEHVVFVESLKSLKDASNHSVLQWQNSSYGTSGMYVTRYVPAAWDVSEAQDGSVWAWYMKYTHPSDTTSCDFSCDYVLFIGAEGGVNASLACAEMFANCTDLKYVDFRDNFHTVGATSMEKMFYNCQALREIDITCFNTANVTNMSNMFYGINGSCKISIDLNRFNTSNVTEYDNFMYYGEEINGVPWTDLFN